MTDQDINAAVAEACGWVDIFTATGKEEWLGTFAYKYGGKVMGFHADQSKDDHAHEIPNYCGDLNAMHEAEKLLNEKQQVWYLQKLTQVRFREGVSGMIACMIDKTTFATARQRAEAFLRTLGKWRETTTPATPVSDPALTGGNVQTGARTAAE
jgi:hypothetical protein